MKRNSSRPAILGIWRLGELLHVSRTTELSLAQPADAVDSPRWDYVVKRSVDSEDIESVQQITRFAAAAAEAFHPNLVAVLDGSTSAATPYVVMPLLEGASMKWHLKQTTKPLPVALWLVRQVAQALEALHTAGWVHGDVKPENVVVGPRGHVTLVDLGFACRAGTVARGHYRGTPDYSAPETLLDDVAAMTPMDVFSLGRVLDQWLQRANSASGSLVDPIAELAQRMTVPQAKQRPSAGQVARQLLQHEIETLGRHIGPTTTTRAA